MKHYVPCPTAGWPEIAEALGLALQHAGRLWPHAAAVTDLRWHVDQRALVLLERGIDEPTHEQLIEGVPGRPKLIKRWGWTDHEVRKLLDCPALWWDDYRWGPQSPADRQGSASGPPGGRQLRKGATPTIEEVSPAGRQEVASGPPAELHTRVPTPPSSPQSGPPRESAPAREVPAPRWARGWPGHEPAAVEAGVCAVSGSIRGRHIEPSEAASDAPYVRAVLQLVPELTLSELAQRAELVSRWGRESSDGLDDLGGQRPDGTHWTHDRSRRVQHVLDVRKWLDRYDAARRWASAPVQPRAASAARPQGPPARASPSLRGRSTAEDGVLHRIASRRTGQPQELEVRDGDG